jgi:methyl coenzyme M reductase subunit D
MKQGVISVQLNYEFEDNKTNEEVKQYLQEIELPSGYQVDTFEFVGIWNTTTDKWEEI